MPRVSISHTGASKRQGYQVRVQLLPEELKKATGHERPWETSRVTVRRLNSHILEFQFDKNGHYKVRALDKRDGKSKPGATIHLTPKLYGLAMRRMLPTWIQPEWNGNRMVLNLPEVFLEGHGELPIQAPPALRPRDPDSDLRDSLEIFNESLAQIRAPSEVQVTLRGSGTEEAPFKLRLEIFRRAVFE